ncbi:MAG: uroporphyrinogen decarboxylase family protein, partial [Caldimonas sp.]
LIGFAGSPWTLACYMVEGGGSDDYRLVKTMLYARPDLMHRMLAVNADAVALYLNAQIDAGAQAVMLFDSWGGVLADGAFQTFSLAYTARVLRQLRRDAEGRRVPHIVFTKGGGPWLEAIAGLGADVVGVDWTVHLGQARQRVGPGTAVQGNLDPCALFAGEAAIRAEVGSALAAFGPAGEAATAQGHVFNLGHGISQHTPPDGIGILVDAVHELSPAFHRRQAP